MIALVSVDLKDAVEALEDALSSFQFSPSNEGIEECP